MLWVDCSRSGSNEFIKTTSINHSLPAPSVPLAFINSLKNGVKKLNVRAHLVHGCSSHAKKPITSDDLMLLLCTRSVRPWGTDVDRARETTSRLLLHCNRTDQPWPWLTARPRDVLHRQILIHFSVVKQIDIRPWVVPAGDNSAHLLLATTLSK